MADSKTRAVLVTGAAGFIGAHVVQRLLVTADRPIVGLDNLNDYYDVGLKRARLRMLEERDGLGRLSFVRGDILDEAALDDLFVTHHVDLVIHLAAQAGVRHSLEAPRAFVETNVLGFLSILEACRRHRVRHLLYASSSSVYGLHAQAPRSSADQADRPVSLYAATKRSDELMAHAYSSLYGIPCTGVRPFTVYGPWGRPDMAYYSFADRIVAGEPLPLYNRGDLWRDFTYVDDVVEAIVRLMACIPGEDGDGVRHLVYDVGNARPVSLLHFVETLERVLVEEGVAASSTAHELLPMQPGDVYRTCADVAWVERRLGALPHTPLEEGLRHFARWYGHYHGGRSRSESPVHRIQ